MELDLVAQQLHMDKLAASARHYCSLWGNLVWFDTASLSPRPNAVIVLLILQHRQVSILLNFITVMQFESVTILAGCSRK